MTPRCPYCQTRPIRPHTHGGPKPVHCGRRACDRARDRELYAARRSRREVMEPPPSPDVVRAIERTLARAAAVRIEARRAGDPRYQIDPWAMRPGRSTCDGECRVMEVSA